MATKKETTEETISELVEQQSEPATEPLLDAVIIIKNTAEDGTITTEVITNGGVQSTEVQTLIEIGLKGWRKKIGLEV